MSIVIANPFPNCCKMVSIGLLTIEERIGENIHLQVEMGISKVGDKNQVRSQRAWMQPAKVFNASIAHDGSETAPWEDKPFVATFGVSDETIA
ncbi:MAG: hypothetical protein IGS48_07370 [Oscillatoriales cyanobacterium C42_A2020_001]|nr:hypothetical protein [Leptolyngbyaceae cyanobacterium C42_A2020_001]